MKFTSVTLGCSLLLTLASAPSFALNEVRATWYASALGNSAVVETTVGCIDKEMMYEKHSVTANTWDDKWHQSMDYDWTFALYNNQRLPDSYRNGPEFIMNTSQLHDSNGSTVDAQGNAYVVNFYSLRPYEPTNSKRQRIDNASNMVGYIGLDAQCDFL